MNTVSAEHVLSDLVLQHPSLIPIIHLNGITSLYDGKTICQICKEMALNESYLINLLSVFLDNQFVPTETLPSYSVLQLTAFISAIDPFFSSQYQALSTRMLQCFKLFKNQKDQDLKRLLQKKLINGLKEYGQYLSERQAEHRLTVLPHVHLVYEWYYSPDYTSRQSDLLNFSLEFYEGKMGVFQHVFEDIKRVLEQARTLSQADLSFSMLVYEFYRLHHDVLAQDRIEQKLLKPLVLQMEESIITTFRKKNKRIVRNNYLSLPEKMSTPDLLSPREKEVLICVAQGLMNKEIADLLKIGLTTVISHRKNLVEKLGIRTIPGLTVYAYSRGYLDESDFHSEG